MQEISPADAREQVEGATCFVDIRDPLSFADGRIRGARHLGMQNLEAFLAEVPQDCPLVVYCYHGHSSRDAAAFLSEKGYASVASLQGGFEYWRQHFPDTIESDNSP